MMKIISLFSLMFSVSVFAAKEAPSAAVKGTVDFYSVGKPSMLKIHGTDSELSGSLNKSSTGEISGTFTVPMKEFVTGMKLRDSHMRNKVFEVEKYPNAELVLNSFKAADGAMAPFTGKLKFHGVEKEIKGEAKVTGSPNELQHEAVFNIKLTDFNITPPEFAGMKIEDDVKVEVKGTAKSE